MVWATTITEHKGIDQLQQLHQNLPEVLHQLIVSRGMEAAVDPLRTKVRINVLVAQTECEVGLRVLYHAPAMLGSTRSDCWCTWVTAMDEKKDIFTAKCKSLCVYTLITVVTSRSKIIHQLQYYTVLINPVGAAPPLRAVRAQILGVGHVMTFAPLDTGAWIHGPRRISDS